MHYSTLGSSSLNVSQIGLGCMSLPADPAAAIPIIHRATDLGINYFDTADIYQDGHNEEVLGEALKNRRDKVIIASKAGNIVRPDGSGLDWNPSKQHILKSIEGSLKRLNTDYIDLYQLHGGTLNDNIDESIEAFELLKSQGKIRFYGISSIRPNVIAEYIRRSSIVSVMTQYSLLDRRPEEQTLEWLRNNNIGVVTRGSVALGLLVDKPPKAYLEHSAEAVKKAAQAVASISGTDRSRAQTSIRYVLQNPAVNSAVVGIRTIEQLEDAVGTITSPELTGEQLLYLQQSVNAFVYREHRTTA